MKYLAIALLLSTPALSEAPFEQPPGSYQRIYNGPDILTIGETAASYFEEIADAATTHPSPDDPFNPKNYLRDRDGLSPAEIADVLKVAVQVNYVSPVIAEDGCKALREATTPDAMLKVLEADEAAAVSERRQKGDSWFTQLPTVTRAHLYRVLIEYRKTIAVGRQDWRKVRNTAPEALEAYRAATCNNAVVQQ